MAVFHRFGKVLPSKLSKCWAWWNSSRGVTIVDGLVSAWADQSGNGRHLSQSDPTKRPSLVANQLNGRSVIRNAAPKCLTGTGYLTGAHTIIAVVKSNIAASTGGSVCIVPS